MSLTPLRQSRLSALFSCTKHVIGFVLPSLLTLVAELFFPSELCAANTIMRFSPVTINLTKPTEHNTVSTIAVSPSCGHWQSDIFRVQKLSVNNSSAVKAAQSSQSQGRGRFASASVCLLFNSNKIKHTAKGKAQVLAVLRSYSITFPLQSFLSASHLIKSLYISIAHLRAPIETGPDLKKG